MAESCSSSPLFVAEHDPSASQVSHASLSIPSSLFIIFFGGGLHSPYMFVYVQRHNKDVSQLCVLHYSDWQSIIWMIMRMWFCFFYWCKLIHFFFGKRDVQYCMLKTCFLLNFDSNPNCIWKLAFLIYFKAIFKLTNLGTKIK